MTSYLFEVTRTCRSRACPRRGPEALKASRVIERRPAAPTDTRPASKFSGLNRLPPIHLATENDRGSGFLHPFNAADLVKQLVQLFRRIAAQPGHVVELATYGAELLDLRHGTEAPHHVLARTRLDRDPDIGLQTAIDHPLTQSHAITGNDLGFFQTCQPRGDRGARDPQLPRQHRHAFTGIDLQGGNQLTVD